MKLAIDVVLRRLFPDDLSGQNRILLRFPRIIYRPKVGGRMGLKARK